MQQNISLDIKGMTCASCVNRIEKVLKKDEGIILASVNLATEKAKVEFDPSRLDISKIIELISRAGYEAKISSQKAKESKADELKKEKYLIILSILLTLPLALPMAFEPFGYHIMPSPWVQLVLATPIQFFIGARFYNQHGVPLSPKPEIWNS